jgi:hypothetical protein
VFECLTKYFSELQSAAARQETRHESLVPLTSPTDDSVVRSIGAEEKPNGRFAEMSGILSRSPCYQPISLSDYLADKSANARYTYILNMKFSCPAQL